MYDSNPKAVAIMKQGVIVGHLPRKPDDQNCAADLCMVQYSRGAGAKYTRPALIRL